MKLHLILLTAALSWGSLIFQKTEAEAIFTGYLEIKEALVKGDAKRAQEKAVALEHSLQSAAGHGGGSKDHGKPYAGILDEVRQIASAKKVEEQRMHLGRLSEKLWSSGYKDRNNSGKTLYYFYCPMKKAHWISDSPDVRNPFFGQQMLTCGKAEDSNNK